MNNNIKKSRQSREKRKYKTIERTEMCQNKEKWVTPKTLIEKMITFFYKGGQYTCLARKRGDSHYQLLEGNFKGQEINIMNLIN